MGHESLEFTSLAPNENKFSIVDSLGNIKNAMELKLGVYKRFKGKEYKVISVAKHSETLEEMVVYKALYGEKELWVRPLKMFTEEIERGDYRGPRFLWIRKEE